jgi:hypothetical protein
LQSEQNKNNQNHKLKLANFFLPERRKNYTLAIKTPLDDQTSGGIENTDAAKLFQTQTKKKIKHLPPTNFHSDARCASKKQRNITAATHSNYSGKQSNAKHSAEQSSPCYTTETTEEQNETGGIRKP